MFDISVYLPSNVLTNEMLKSEFKDWDYMKIQDKVGIRQRHIAGESETALDLAYEAAQKLFIDNDRETIDFIILCTQSPDYFLPTTACILQDNLGLPKTVGALDINLGCSGYVYGLALAKGLLSAGISQNLLLVTSETYTKHIYKKDIANRAIFGDAATASLLSKQSVAEIGEFTLGTDGSGKNNLIIKNGGLRNASDSNAREIEYGSGNIYTENNLYMNGPEIFNFTIAEIPALVKKNLIANDLTINDIDYFVFHQANQFMLDYLRKKLGIPAEKFCIDMVNTGNTVSCTIPIALKNAADNGIVRTGNKVMLVGFGVGYSWGAVTIKI
jgi:3-oxoacyl-[acyl-carrier-protein] synthase III